MSKKNSHNHASESFTARPRLGTVMHFTLKAVSNGIKQLEAESFHIASSSDFKSASSVPNDFGGADVQYFERFGIVIMRREQECLNPVLQRAVEHKVVAGARVERRYKALGFRIIETAHKDSIMPLLLNSDQEYLCGYRNAVNQLKKSFVSNSSETDIDGHGTHCIGTACGSARSLNVLRDMVLLPKQKSM